MSGFVRTSCSALFMYLAMMLIASSTHIVQPTTLVLAEHYTSRRTAKSDRKVQLKNNVFGKHGSLRERKHWFKIIEQQYSPSHSESYSDHGTSSGKGKGKGGKQGKDGSKGKGGGIMSKGKGKGKGGKGGNGKGAGLPEFCSELDFEVDHNDIDDYAYGKGKGKERGLSKGKGKGKGKGYGNNMSTDNAYGKGKGKGGYEKENCQRTLFKKARRISDISIFVSLLHQTDLYDIFLCNGPFTVLAPSNAAFENNPTVTSYLSDAINAEELRDVLLYHILPGLTLIDDFTAGSVDTLLGDVIHVSINPVTFNDVTQVEEGNLKACNGVIHVVDNILLPPGFDILPDICPELDFGSSVDRRLHDDGALCDPNVLETARMNEDLSTFVALIEIAGLADYFLCAGPFTCLAPTNDAFNALDPEIVESLLDPANVNILQDILLYHLVPGLVLSEDFVDGSLLTLLDGQTIDVSINPVIFNGEVGIVDPDILACNGVIHALENVLLPVTATDGPATTPSDTPTSVPVGSSAAPTATTGSPSFFSSSPNPSTLSAIPIPTVTPVQSPVDTTAAPIVSTVPVAGPLLTGAPSQPPIDTTAAPTISPVAISVPIDNPVDFPVDVGTPVDFPVDVQSTAAPSVSPVPTGAPSVSPAPVAAAPV